METFSALLALCAGNSPAPVNSPHKGQWRRALMFYFICAWINDWVNNREAGDLRRHRGHYDVNMMTHDWNDHHAFCGENCITVVLNFSFIFMPQLWVDKTLVTWGRQLCPHYCPFVRGVQWSPMGSPQKGSLIWSFGVFFVLSLKAVEQTVDLPVISCTIVIYFCLIK